MGERNKRREGARRVENIKCIEERMSTRDIGFKVDLESLRLMLIRTDLRWSICVYL